MKKNTFAAVLGLALATLMAPFSAKAEVTGGDIYSVDLAAYNNGVTEISAANPLRIGQNVTLRVRLVNKGYNEATTVKPWRFVPTSSLAGADPATSVFAPQFGFMLGGQQVFADYVGSQQTVGKDGVANFTDFFFTYTVKSGDLALPARFMATTGKSVQGESDATDYAIRYCNYYGSYWKISNDNGDTAIFHFAADELMPDPDPNAVAGAATRAITGTGLNVYVKTVDFDTNYFEEPATIGAEGVWRKFYQGLSTSLPAQPTIRIDGLADAAATMYVWVEDPTIANVLASDAPETIVQTIGGVVYTRYVIKVPIAKGAASATFKLQGVAVGTTHVRMSSSRELAANAAGDVIEDWVERKILVEPAPNPFVSLEMLNPAGDPQTAFTCTADYKSYLAQLRVSLSQSYTAPVTVALKVKNAGLTLEADLCDADIAQRLIGFSNSSDPTDLPWQDRQFTVTFEAGETSRTIYLYGLGKTTDLADGQKITLGSTVTSPAAAVTFYNGAFVDTAISIEGMKPTITSPVTGEELNEGALGASYTLDIAVSDSFHNLQNSGWTVKIKGTAMGDTAWHEITDCEVEDGVISEEVDFDQICDNEILQIKVIDPEGNESAIVKPRITVSEGKTVTARSDKGSAAYAESQTETAKVYFDLTQSNGKPLYAFLRPLNADASNRVQCAQLAKAGNTGVLIAKGATSSGDNCATVQVLDGDAAALFEVVLCTTSTYSDAKRATSYSFGQLQLSVTNVIPRVKSVSMGGTTVKTNGGAMSKTVAMNVSKKFTVDIAEPGARDLEATGTDAFQVQWKFGAEDWQTVSGNPNTTFMNHVFSAPGVQEVSVRCRDKDMPAGQYSEEFTFSVTVLDQPTITITPRLDTRSYYEDQTGSDYAFDVALSTPPDMPSGTRLNVNLIVEKIDPAGAYKVSDLELSKTNVTFASGMTGGQSFFLKRLDGTAASAGSGFRITARATNAADDTEGKTWDAGEIEIYILNREPEILLPAERVDAEGNAIVTKTSKGTEIKLSWSIKDVVADTNGISVVWSTSEGATKEYKNPADGNVMSGTHTFKFDESGDNKSVMMTVTDKDGGTTTRTFYYAIDPSKTLTLIPHGPTGGYGTTLSKKYNTASGLGEGRVYAKNRSGVENFVGSYSCGLVTSWTIHGYGYKVGDVSGAVSTFPTREDPIDANGNYAAAGGYTYDDTVYDSFLYAWIQIYRSESESGASGSTYTVSLLNGSTAPEYSALKADVGSVVALPTEAYENGTYENTIVEAIFSKEWLPSDNMGDINKDGVPDIAVDKYGLGVIDLGTGEITGDDLASGTYKYNEDGDYLPNTANAKYASFIPGLSNTWVTVGEAFTARLELRGYGDAFNDAFAARFPDGVNNSLAVSNVKPDKNYADPEVDETSTLTALEWWAFTNYCAQAALDPADTASWSKWSPERPTDPTELDTDGDELPDGYEYYIWYRAHVGYVDAAGNYQRLSGRRYVPERPCEPTDITAEEIEKIYDPIVALGEKANTLDTDNDGLPDLIEFMIGTNPFDYDTDHDGLPDGWEVTISKTDPLLYATDGTICDAARNTDSDSHAVIRQDVELTLTVDAEGHTNWVYGAEFEAEPVVVTNVVDDVEVEATNWCLKAKGAFFDTWQYGLDGLLNKGLAFGANAARNFLLPGEELVTTNATITLRHFQVFEELGFDPRTAWGNNTARKDPMVNTAAYTHMDEFMTMAFYYHCGIDGTRVIELDQITPTADYPLTTIWANYTTDPNNADTDKDHMPDGWELYIMYGKFGHSPNYDWNNLPNDQKDLDGDGLTQPLEFQSQQGCWAYPVSEYNTTIVNENPAWANKKWPTNPLDPDTDEDGLSDGAEEIFCYANITDPTWKDEVQPGGGLNPCSWDTDYDGLPDPWEVEFSGTYVVSKTETATKVESNTDTNGVTTASTNTVSTTTGGFWNNDGMDPTVWDSGVPSTAEDRETHSRDYDHDGLLNWQEYMVGAMRCWRYDDTTDRWGSHTITAEEVQNYITDHDGDAIYRIFLEFDNAHGMYNPGLSNEFFDQFSAFFSRCRKPFDPNYGRYYMFRDGIYHDLQIPVDILKRNRYGTRTKIGAPYATVSPTGTPIFPGKYICCDPRLADTDCDGMDDFYELYHGLNPLLGKSRMPKMADPGMAYDVVFDAYFETAGGLIPWSADNNHWTDGNRTMEDQPFRLKGSTDSIYDFYQFPWLNGLAAADPDGDNVRNQQEAIMPKVQAASTFQHTDPSPLWMTDSYDPNSLTYRFYNTANPGWAEQPALVAYSSDVDYFVWHYMGQAITNYYYDIPGMDCIPDGMGGYLVYLDYVPFSFNSAGSMFSYEENEGYDSDHDYLSDFEENQGKTKSSSDPQQHDSPIRRQAMWFGGQENPGFLQNQVPSMEYPPEVEAAAEARQDFLYYTAEAWVKPDGDILTQQGLFTVLERVLYTGAANAGDENYLRKNFLIGVRNGRWYTKFDSTGTDLNSPVEITDGPVATTNWTHIAATYGPENDDESDPTAKMELRLYVDGICYNRQKTALQPEHNVETIRVGALGELSEGGGTLPWTENVSILVGASVIKPAGIVFDYAWRSRLYLFITEDNPLGLGPQTTIENYGNFFKGYVDEVRVWDGARNAAAIKADYANRTRYTSELVKENRQSVFAAWSQEAVRSPSNKSGVAMPPELRYHWAFDHVAGAIDAENVQQTPAGFTTSGLVTDAMAMWCRPEGWKETWWDNIAVRSTVFQDTAWIPWVLNTVAHLPRFDKTTLDSVYWSFDYAGYESAVSNGYASFSFPLSAEVDCRRVKTEYTTSEYSYEKPLTLDTRWDLIVANDDADENLTKAFRFALRNRNLEGDDLLIMGGAFPKRISTAEGGMWDDGSAADAWAQTGEDADHNSLPDWWEEYARENYCTDLDPNEPILWDTTVTYHGVSMAAWQAYLRDLANGLVTIDGEVQYREEYADHHDADGDGMPDWWENLYGIDTGSVEDADADPDHDGLSNYQEYLLSEVYPSVYGLGDLEGVEVPMLNPTLAHSKVGQPVTDYYLRYSTTVTNSVLNSAGQSVFELNEYFGEIVTDHDFMEDWWENTLGRTFATSKKYDPLKDYDEDGWSNFAECRTALWGGYFSADLVDKWTGTTSDQHVNGYPEPIIGVRVNYHGQRDIGGMPLVIRTLSGQTPRVDATFVVSADAVEQTRYIGGFAADEFLRGHLSPGLINASSIVFECAPASPDPTDTNEVWEVFTQVVPSADASSATIMIDGATKFGTVDCTTGEYELDMSKFSLAGGAGQYIFRVTYTSHIGHEWPQTVYVSDTQELSSGSGSGRVREGRNTIEVFIDLDGNGILDEGEPYGSVRNVQIGWHKVPVVTVEVKDDSPIMPCVLVGSAGQAVSNDTGTVASTLTTKIQIVRQDINGIEAERTLVTKTVVNDDRAYVTEADACVASKPDLDWVWLNKDATRRGIDKVEYATYRVEEVATLADGTTTNIPIRTFVKTFAGQRPVASAVSPIDTAPVYAASPTLAFTASDETATAYRLQIKYAGATGTPVYDSGCQLLPGRTGTTVGASAYEITPPVYVGAPVYCSTLTNHVVFADGSNYEWRVALYNAKYNSDSNDFKDSEEWSKWATFQTDVGHANRSPQIATGYGAAALAVRYFGPATVEPGSVVVEAYENADFRGQAMAQVRIMDEEGVALLTNSEDVKTPNAIFRGLKPGKVYFRAFIDRKNSAGQDDNVRQSWESWGYANYVDSGYKAIYNPKAKDITVSTADWVVGAEADMPIFIEDTDVNQNGFADCLEAKYADASLTDEEEKESVDWWEWAEADEDDMTEGDVMAYYETTMWLVTVCDDRNPADVTYGAYLYDGAKAPVSGTDASNFAFVRAYQYGDLYGVGLPVTEDLTGCRVYGAAKQVTVVYVHEQVRELFGFNADTAVPNGQTNTRAFTAQDKQLVLRYLEQTGRLGLTPPAGYATFEEYVLNSGDEKVYEKYTLKPGVIDNDYDGIADGWELYVGSDPLNFADRESDADGDGLSLVEEYDRGNPTDPASLDTDNDGVSDYYAYCYHLKTAADALADNDGDGLSNYAEYLISEVFNFAKVDPDNAKTDGACIDYFRKAGELYLGEIFTDHDRMDDALEDLLFDNCSRYVYNPQELDDQTGWSRYDAVRAYAWVGTHVEPVVVTNELDGVVSTNDVVVSNYAGRPVPELNLTVSYLGTQVSAGDTATLVVKTYTDEAMQKPDAVFVMTNAVGRGVATVKLTTPTTGAVKGGKNRLEAYLVAGGSSSDSGSSETGSVPAYTAGYPYGFVADVTIGWNSGAAALELTDVSPVFSRVDIATGASDRTTIWGTDGGDLVTNDVQTAEEALSGGQYNHVRIVPYLVSGTLSDAETPYEQIVNYAQNRVVAEFDVDTQNRGYISEADFIRDGAYDVDWENLKSGIVNNSRIVGAVGDVTAVKYRVVLGASGPIGPDHNLDTSTVVRAFSTLIERRYEPSARRTLPTALETAGVLYGGQPTFKWRLDEPTSASTAVASASAFGCSYTAFQIQVADTNNTVVFDSGVVRAPAHDAAGRFVWTAPVCPRDGTAFAPVGNWKWRVAMYNAKFKPIAIERTNGWSAWSTFSTAVNQQQEMNDHGYSSIGVSVKYMGPAEVISGYQTTQLVIAQAFATPDFAGEPLAEAAVTNALDDVSTAFPNVTLKGLPAGKAYYVRAYIDTNENGVLDDWESWGYAEGVELASASVVKPVVGLYIEDSDTDGDWLPDAWEYKKNGNLTTQGADVLADGKILFSTDAYNAAKNNLASISSGLGGASLTIFENGSFASVILGSSTKVTSVADIRAAVEGELKVKKGSLKITAITLDANTGAVKLAIDAEVAPTVAGELVNQIYNLAAGTTKTVVVKVYRKVSLATASWGEPVKAATVTIGAGAAEVTVEGLTITPEEMKSGFYKIEVEE